MFSFNFIFCSKTVRGRKFCVICGHKQFSMHRTLPAEARKFAKYEAPLKTKKHLMCSSCYKKTILPYLKVCTNIFIYCVFCCFFIK
jgi:hypothetical protein